MSPVSVSAYAPATVANFGPGFDVLGLALDSPGDTVTVAFGQTPGVSLTSITGDRGLLPRDPDRNTACSAARDVLQMAGSVRGIELRLDKGLPLASGLGSSAASAAAAAVAANALLGEPFSREELLPACIEAEAAVSGRHADNVAPALLGGIVLVTGLDAASLHRLPVPDNLHLAIVSPAVAVPTAQARAVLPPTVPLATMVHQTAPIALLIHALFREAQAAAQQAGALTTVISGAGPSLCALCDAPRTAEQVAVAFRELYAAQGIEATARAAQIAKHGAAVIDCG